MRDSKVIGFLQAGYDRFLEAQQVRMANNFEGLPLLAILGLFCGVLAGAVIIAFRLSLEAGAGLLLADSNPDSFEQLSPEYRLVLCVLGGFLVGLILHLLKDKSRSLGVVHVLERLDYHQGHLPLKNAVIQFASAAISLLSGQSVGREGPSVHLGATAGSILGRSLRVPNNSVRILVGCGVAAAIAAAFNTPLAGVIFAMEVVIMEYTVVGFAPVILAAVSATTLTHFIFGDELAFQITVADIHILSELPLVAILGAVIGILAAGFIQLTLLTTSLFSHQSLWLRGGLAGLVTGLIAWELPQIMGTGYDTVGLLLSAQLGLGLMLALVVAKLFATSFAIGIGIPAGLIGPTLFIGAAAGGTLGVAASLVFDDVANAGFYAMLGMAAMMGASLQAPLAALVALLELTGSQSIILPGMTAVITATLVSRIVFGKSSIYRHLMLARGLDYRNSPLSKALRRVGVASVMDRSIMQQPRVVSRLQAEEILRLEPRWILLTDEDDLKTSLLPATDLARYLNEIMHETDHAHELDLLRIPAKRLDTAGITMVATLQEAYERMSSEQCTALFIRGAHGGSKQRIYGVVTREHIERSYQV